MTSLSREANKPRPLSLISTPRPLQLASANPVASPTFLPTSATHLSRSNSTSSTQPPVKRPIPKRLSSISYSPSLPADNASAFAPNHTPSLPSAPLDRPIRPAGVASPGSSPTILEEHRAPPAAHTLAERHADLLQFIAQKESKCLELRQQLEQHEAELKVLKRKWERIVSKSKPSPASASGSGGMIGADGMVEAIKDLGRLFGGLSGLDDLSATGTPTSLRNTVQPDYTTSGSHIPDSVFEIPVAEAKTPSTSTFVSSTQHSRIISTSINATPPSSTVARSRSKRRHTPSRSSSASSVSSLNPITSANSTRDSLSSVSTAASSVEIYPNKRSSGDHMRTHSVNPTSVPGGEYHTEGTSHSGEQSTPLAGSLGWVPGGINKKWNQLSRNETFSRNSHRASLILSDVTDISNTLLNSLSNVLSPVPNEVGTSSKQLTTQIPLRRCAQLPSASGTSPSDVKVSLLDGSEDENEISRVAIPVTLQPSPSPSSMSLNTSPSLKPPVLNSKNLKAADPEDEWNW